jgi:prepilin-type N-terminal cleavage/methylation domain-containing protein
MDPGRHRTRDDRGETLLELLVAVAIMGIAVVAVIGGLGTSIMLSDIHRKQATAGAAVRNYGEAIAAWVASGNYDPSAAPDYSPATVHYTVNAGFTASLLSVGCWSGSVWQGCGTDTGLQRVNVEVRSNDGPDCNRARVCEHLTVVVRKPCRVSDPICS